MQTPDYSNYHQFLRLFFALILIVFSMKELAHEIEEEHVHCGDGRTTCEQEEDTVMGTQSSDPTVGKPSINNQ